MKTKIAIKMLIRCYVLLHLLLFTLCLESHSKTFIVSENTEIITQTLKTEIVYGISSCALMCNEDQRCQCFTICRNFDVICSLFDRVHWSKNEKFWSENCTYYEENRCGKYYYFIRRSTTFY